jgi:hypothetical protein
LIDFASRSAADCGEEDEDEDEEDDEDDDAPDPPEGLCAGGVSPPPHAASARIAKMEVSVPWARRRVGRGLISSEDITTHGASVHVAVRTRR